jgi:hypothetical protein
MIIDRDESEDRDARSDEFARRDPAAHERFVRQAR